jgi:hypothetical protein
MSYIIRDENGGERVVAPWPSVTAEDIERARQMTERFPIEMSPTNEPTGWDRLEGLDPLGDRSELIRTTGGGGRKGFLGLGGRYPTWEHTYDTDTGISTIDTEGYGTRRYRTVTDPDGYMREELIPDFSPSDSLQMLGEFVKDLEEVSARQRRGELTEELRKRAAAAEMQHRTLRQEPLRQGTLGLDRFGRTTVNY